MTISFTFCPFLVRCNVNKHGRKNKKEKKKKQTRQAKVLCLHSLAFWNRVTKQLPLIWLFADYDERVVRVGLRWRGIC